MIRLIIVVILLCPSICFAQQWNTSGAGNIYNMTTGMTGRVGIGTQEPVDQLEVVSENKKVGFNSASSESAGGSVGISRADGSKSMFLGFSSQVDDPVIYGKGGSTEMRFVSGGGSSEGFGFYNNVTQAQAFAGNRPGWSAFKIAGNGNIGIGTSTPNALLEAKVQHAANENREIRIGSYYQNNFQGLGFNYQLNSQGHVYKHIVEYSGSTKYTTLTLQEGKVGIGSINPDEALTVKGKIHTQEVRVDLNGVLAPDYVFETDYKLPTLVETETYIKANKHLPEVPSAKEMEANGVNLKEMNLILLKKVEELTLHLIEQNKVIVKQNDRIEQLEKLSDK